MQDRGRRKGFTLIELLVVIAVIAVLIGVLLPALSKSREAARVVRCQASIRSVGQGVISYTIDSKYFPAAYLYPSDPSSLAWKLSEQRGATNPIPENGYIHWTWSLFLTGAVNDQSFTCPSALHGGAPRTNPGPRQQDWEDEQINDLGGTAGTATPMDRQVSRLAFGGNAAIFPRNKFDPNNIDGKPRKNQFVNASWVDGSAKGGSGTILAAEFGFSKAQGWRTVGDLAADGTGPYVSRSHRPFTPFIGLGSGSDVYDEQLTGSKARFRYPIYGEIASGNEVPVGGLVGSIGDTSMNAFARHHPGIGNGYGGKGNVVFVDGHVGGYNVVETIEKQLWGDKFYSISGPNAVDLTKMYKNK